MTPPVTLSAAGRLSKVNALSGLPCSLLAAWFAFEAEFREAPFWMLGAVFGRMALVMCDFTVVKRLADIHSDFFADVFFDTG